MISPKVAIIVLNWNGRDCLHDCLISLSNLHYDRKDIIVVDNASTDGSYEEAKRSFPNYHFMTTGTNLGFAGGMNAGIRAALERGADWCWLFNNDATAHPDSLNILIHHSFALPQAGLLSPIIFDPQHESLWFGKAIIRFFRMRTEHVMPKDAELGLAHYSSPILTGCALLIRKEVFARIGFLDETFFLYYEDADFSLRASQAGFGLSIVPQAIVQHKESSQSNPEKIYHLVRSGLIFFDRHTPWYIRPYLCIYATIRRTKNLIDRLLGREEAFRVGQAYADYYAEHPSLFAHIRQLR
jgi:GT2 family glycosyltransferase